MTTPCVQPDDRVRFWTVETGLQPQRGTVCTSEIRYGRKAQYLHHTPRPEDEKVTDLSRYNKKRLIAETLEEDAMRRLRGGDIIFKLIPSESWRLSNTWFGTSDPSPIVSMFHLVEESTLGTPTPRMFKATRLEHVLLDFLLQRAEFVDQQAQPRVVEFASLKASGREE